MTDAIQRTPALAAADQPMRWHRLAVLAGVLALVGVAVVSVKAFDLSLGSFTVGPIFCLAIIPLVLLLMWPAEPVADTNGGAGKS